MDENENEIQQQIEQRIGELPLDIQNAILSSDFGDKILAIGTSAKLHIDQVQTLNDMAMLAMLGFMPLESLESEIAQQVAVPADTAAKIASDINAQVFFPIRESLKRFAAEKNAPPAAPAPAPAGSRPSLAQVLPKESISQMPPAAPEVKPSSIPAAPASASPLASNPGASLPAIPVADMHPADIALTQKTVAVPAAQPAPSAPSPVKPSETKAAPPKPQDYKADPYREPIA